jgi:sec-independent protein translocase protein TatA
MPANIGIWEVVIIAVVIFVLFGGKKLPELAKGISKASEEFSKGLKSGSSDEKNKDKKSEDSE